MNNRSANHSRFFSSCFKIRFINWDIQRDVTKPETERFKRKQMPHCLRVFFWKIESVSFILIPSASDFVKKKGIFLNEAIVIQPFVFPLTRPTAP